MNRSHAGRWWLVCLGLTVASGWVQAQQINNWNSDTGGNWDNASSWSLGVPPGSAQSIMFTNAYWKAVVIDSSTVSSTPQSLAVNSLTITSVSPSNGVYTTRNTLLMNYASPGNPLAIGAENNPGNLLIDHDSTFAMYFSGLIVNNALGETNSRLGGFQVDGNFIQSDNSEVVAGFLDLTGTYSMTNGQFFVGTQFINGTFNQQGGTNTGAIVAGTNGNYQFFDGAFNGDITLYPGHFTQWGGTVSANLRFYEPASAGVYLLEGGLLFPGDLEMGATPLTNYDVLPGGVFEQSGGTNNPTSLAMGFGTYYLTNGVLTTPTMTLITNTWAGGLYAGDFEQYGGYVTNGGLTMIGGTNIYLEQTFLTRARYELYRGILDTPSITMNVASFGVAGIGVSATNRVGTLAMNASVYGIADGGWLQVDELQVTNGSQIMHLGGTLSGIRNIFLGNGSWWEQSAGAQLGQLQLLSGTNSSIYLQSASGVLQFADSSGVPWAGDGLLTIGTWSGSLSGGGSQQIVFGSSASGLTAQQLTHVQFLNPAGLPGGTYGARILSSGEIVPDQNSSSSGPLNSWIKPTSGNWDDASSWSLGVLPNGSQSVLIANTNWKAVAISPSTPINFPASMTVSNLFIEGPTNTENTLLLNNFGTTAPLTVLNGLLLQNNAQILNFNSSMVLQGAAEITNSIFIQDGGVTRATNGQMSISGSEIDITNGVFEAGAVSLGYPVSSRFNQYGGSVKIQSLGFSSYVFGTNVNSVALYGGTLDLPNGMSLYGEPGGISYFQSGGTNRTGQVTIEVDYGGFNPSFTLNGGLLADSGVLLYSGYHAPLSITQNGGSHVITNTLSIRGSSANGFSTDPATYNLNGGTLSAGMIELNGNEGDSVFVETNATVSAGTIYTYSDGYFSGHNTHVNLLGGTLSCLNYTNTDGNGTLNQTGGALVVSNLLSFGGSRDVGITLYPSYTFTGGTLTASNINIGGNWIIGDGTNRISNLGAISLGHTTTVSNAIEQFGRLLLPATTPLYLSGTNAAARLSFANSSDETWADSAALEIFNWNGAPAGGGVTQIKFGSDQSGLTASQLNQIHFHIATNLYSAKILNTGEVVPDQLTAPPLTFTQQGNQFILNWPPGYTLQSAPNAYGPYQNVQNPYNVTPPYTNDMTTEPQRFFRLVP